jgi:hypothetical protein
MVDGTWIRSYNNRSQYNYVSNYVSTELYTGTSGYYGAQIGSNNTVDAALFCAGYVSAYNYYYNSSRKLKKDIIHLNKEDNTSALNFVLNDLNFVYYRMKSDDKKIELGLIAEETPEVLVQPGYQGVDYGKISVYNSSAIKALNSKIETIEQRIGKSAKKNFTVVQDFGSEEIKSGEYWVSFSDEFTSELDENIPTVTVTSQLPGMNIYVIEKSKKGFRVSCPQFNDKAVPFDWIAMAKIPSDKEYQDTTIGNKYSPLFTQMLNEDKMYIKNAPVPKVVKPAPDTTNGPKPMTKEEMIKNAAAIKAKAEHPTPTPLGAGNPVVVPQDTERPAPSPLTEEPKVPSKAVSPK